MAPRVLLLAEGGALIQSKVTTTVRGDDEAKRIKDLIKKAGGAYVTIGIHKDAGKYPDGTDVVSVALWNEFGTSTSPERSFFRSAVDGNESLINKWREEAIQNMVEKKWTVKKALELVGFRVQTLIQNKIKSNVPPPNAPSTIAEKRRTGVSPKSGAKPGFADRTGTLIDSGLMLRSVTFRTYPK
jgi:predicted RNase H-related nuclease YkuK (DUF458 family)